MLDYQPRPDLLADRVILVTGAADGVGRAVARACARHGATVILSGFDEAKLEAVYDDIRTGGGPEPASLPLDLDRADESMYLGAASTIGDAFGRLDGLVHATIWAPYLSRIDDYDVADWERVLRINLNAPFMLTQACLPLLRAAKDASVVFTSDRVGRRGLAYWGAFAVAKFGLEGLMQVLAEELRDSSRVRVNTLDPGALRTALRRQLYPAEDPNTLPTTDSVAPAYLYLLGPDSQGISGKALTAQAPRSQGTAESW